jgi:hypothetical protein
VPTCSRRPEVEDADPVAHRQRFVLIVRDEQERDADLPLQRLQLGLHLLAQLQVERAERLVEQQTCGWLISARASATRWRWPPDNCAGRRSPDARQPHHGQQLVGAARALDRGHLAHHQRIGDVVAHAHVGEQRVILEHGVHRPCVGWAAATRPRRGSDASRRRQRETADHAQAGRLARAGRPEQREELAGRDRQVDAVDRAHRRTLRCRRRS